MRRRGFRGAFLLRMGAVLAEEKTFSFPFGLPNERQYGKMIHITSAVRDRGFNSMEHR
jgi:hypothetical protein